MESQLLGRGEGGGEEEEEEENNTNPMVVHFCEAVHAQASGNQVKQASSSQGVTIQTKTIADLETGQPRSSDDYECSITATRRAYDDYSQELVGPGFFILQVKVLQTVYVQSSSALPPSRETVAEMVSTGFSRGNGGRVKFKSLLVESDAFASVLNVETIPDGFTVPPSSYPTAPPLPSTLSPTLFVPTKVPSQQQQQQPWVSISPTRMQTNVPSNPPSLEPTPRTVVVVTLEPTTDTPTVEQPTLEPTVQQTWTHQPTTSMPTATQNPTQTSTAASSIVTEPVTTTTTTTLTITTTEEPTLPSTQASSVASSVEVSHLTDGGKTQETSTTPTAQEDTAEKQDRQPLILGAIAGGVATIVVSCFFIFCVWFPFCSRKDNDSDDNYDRSSSSQRRMGGAGGGGTKTTSSTTAGRIGDLEDATGGVPEIVRLDDHDSLANTSLGDTTPAYAASAVKAPSLMDGNNVNMLDSFDENSLYTSPFSIHADSSQVEVSQKQALESKTAVKSTTGTARPAVRSSPVDIDALDEESEVGDKKLESEGVYALYGNIEIFEPIVRRGDKNGAIATTTTAKPSPAADSKSSATSSSSGPVTKGFDPFADESSFASSTVEEGLGVLDDKSADSPFQSLSFGEDERSSPSSSSSTTKKVHNLRSLKGENNKLLEPMEEEKREVEDDNNSAPYAIADAPTTPPHSPVTAASKRKERFKSSLLRSVLEEARILSEQSRSPSSKSRTSRQSAPSSIPIQKSKTKSTNGRKKLVATLDLLDDDQLFADEIRRGSRSVGAPERRPDGKSKKKKKKKGKTTSSLSSVRSHLSKQQIAEVILGTSGQTNSSGGGGGGKPPIPRLPAARTNEEEDETFQESPQQQQEDGMGNLGAFPREEHWKRPDGKKGQKTRVTNGSSSGRYGEAQEESSSTSSEGNSTPWLFDTLEQTLGPRSPSADLESMTVRSGKSHKSTKSGKSNKSHQSNRSSKSLETSKSRGSDSRQAPPSPEKKKDDLSQHSFNMTSRKTNTTGTVMGERKSNEEEETIIPRTLENDLKRLEFQLPDLYPTEADLVTTSSITASSAGASRSTRSSKHIIKMSSKRRVVLAVPPGKLGIVLADNNDGKGIIVAEVRPTSMMKGMVVPGDKLVAIDGEDCTGMLINDITALMTSRVDRERKLTIVTSGVVSHALDDDALVFAEAKNDDST